MTRARRLDALCALTVLLVAVALWLPRLAGPIDARSDAGVYYVLGTSIYEGAGYLLLNEPGELRAVQYPPGLPALVAAHQWALGTSDFARVGPALRLTFMLLSIALALATYALARRFLAPGWALAATLVATLSLMVYSFSDLLYTETPFALAMVGMALLHRRGQRTGSRWAGAGVGAAAVAAYLLRTAGVALLVAWVAERLLQRRYRQAALRAGVALAPILLWHGYVATVTARLDYRTPAYPYQRASYYFSNVPYAENARLLDPFRPELGEASPAQVLARTLRNTATIPVAMSAATTVPFDAWSWPVKAFGRRLGAGEPTWPAYGPMFAVTGLIVLGAALLVRRGRWFVPLLFLASTGVVCLAPWPEQFHRYLTPSAPFMAIFFVVAAHWLVQRARRGPGPVALVGVALVSALLAGVLVTEAVWAVRVLRGATEVSYRGRDGARCAARHLHYNPAWVTLDAAIDWVGLHAAPGDVMATVATHTAYVRTGVKSVLPPLTVDPAEGQRLLDAVPVRFLIIDSTGYPDTVRYALPIIDAHPRLWRLAHSETAADESTARVYERVR